MTKLTIAALSLLIICGLGVVLLLQQQSLVRLRTDNLSLQQQFEDLRAQNNQLAAAQADNAEVEKQKLRRAQSELLRLRAEVTGLRDATQNAGLRPVQNAPANPAPAPPVVSEAPATKLQASIRGQVATGQTLMTGGWASEPGKRIYVLATPHLQGDNADQVEIKTRIIEIPDAALSKVGLDGFTAEGNESSLNQVIPPDDLEALMKLLEGTEGARLVAQQSLVSTSGKQAELRTTDEQVSGAGRQSLGQVINIVPVISADKSAIDLTLQAGLNRVGR